MWYEFSSIGIVPLPERIPDSPDGKYRYVLNGKTVHIIEGGGKNVTPNVLAVLNGHTDLVTDATWSWDSRYLATAGMDKKIIIWDTANWKPREIIVSRMLNLSALSWRPHDNIIASGTNDGTIALWNVETGEILKLFDAGFPVKALFWPDRNMLVARGSDLKENSAWVYLEGIERVRENLATKAGIPKTTMNRIERLMREAVLKGLKREVQELMKGLDIPLTDAMKVKRLMEVAEEYRFPVDDELLINSVDILTFLAIKKTRKPEFSPGDIFLKTNLRYVPVVLMYKYLEALKNRKICLKPVDEKLVKRAREIVKKEGITSVDDFLKLTLALNVTPRTARMLLYKVL